MEKKERIKTEKQLYLENKELRSRLAEAEEALAAIRSGKVDAILVSGDNGEKVFSLASAETPYRIIIEEMSEGAVILSKDGLILYCNNRFAELVSVPLEQIAGSYFTRFVEESYGSKYDALLQAGLKGNSNGEIACIDRDNNPVHLHFSFRRLPADMPGDVCIVATDISGLKQKEKELRQYHDTLEQRITEKTAELTKTIGELAASHLAVMNMMEDMAEANKTLEVTNKKMLEEIAERKQAEQELRESKALIDAVVENIPMMIFLKEAKDLRFVIFNRAGEELTGYNRGDLLGKNDLDFFPPEQAEHFIARDREVLDGEKDILDIPEEPIMTARKGQRLLHTRKVRIHGYDGTSKYLLGISEDITERKQAENAIIRLNAELEERVLARTIQLEEANKELEAFAYSVSHDLRAPLRAIDGFSEILVDDHSGTLDSEAKRLCSVIRENTQKMDQLIEDLLAFSRMGRSTMQAGHIDMKALAESAFTELTDAKMRARIDFRTDELAPAWGDFSMIRQVWVNLLSNAIKFSSKVKHAMITVDAREHEDEIVYSVTDNGAGFDMQYSDKLFNVFQRLHAARDFEGTGVGLAIVKRVISRHDGRVWAEGNPDHGATFYFSLGKGDRKKS